MSVIYGIVMIVLLVVVVVVGIDVGVRVVIVIGFMLLCFFDSFLRQTGKRLESLKVASAQLSIVRPDKLQKSST